MKAVTSVLVAQELRLLPLMPIFPVSLVTNRFVGLNILLTNKPCRRSNGNHLNIVTLIWSGWRVRWTIYDNVVDYSDRGIGHLITILHQIATDDVGGVGDGKSGSSSGRDRIPIDGKN